MTIKELRERLRKLIADGNALQETVKNEDRELTEDERKQFEGLVADGKEIQAQIKRLEDDEALEKQVLDLGAGLPPDGKPAGGQMPDPRIARRKTIGEQFVENEHWTAWYKQVAPSGVLPDGLQKFTSPGVWYKDLLRRVGRKDLVTGVSDTSAGAFVQTDYTGIYESLGHAPFVILDLLTRRTTVSDLVEFVRQTQRITEATPTAEANVTEYSGATGEVSGEKPEAAMAFEIVRESVKSLPVWIPATKRALADASEVRSLIDQNLRDNLIEELENQIITGNGVGENFTGILNTAGILVQAWNTDVLTTTRQAMTTIEVTGLAKPTAWLFHPADWETIDLMVDLQGRYYFGGPLAMGTRTLWGLPVVTSQAMTQGTGLLGDFRKAILWDRESATISVSDSHADFFIRNMVAILAELRAALGIIRPSAFVEIDLTSGS